MNVPYAVVMFVGISNTCSRVLAEETKRQKALYNNTPYIFDVFKNAPYLSHHQASS
jgi:hypothetical protein